MSLLTLINRPCTLTLRSGSVVEDDYGNEIPGETTVETVCELQQAFRDEPEGQGELSDTRWRLFFLPGVHLETGDSVTVDGDVYELVGDPWTARNPRTQTVSHVEATARRTAGEEGGS